MSNGRRRRRALCIIAASAVSGWVVPREKSEDTEVVTLGVLLPPTGARVRPPGVGGDGKTGPRSAPSLDPAEETLTRLVEEFHKSSDTTVNTAVAGSAAITAACHECVESRISEGAHAVDEQEVQNDMKLAEELKKRASVSPSRAQSPTYGDAGSLEYKTGFVEQAAKIIEAAAMMLGVVPVLSGDSSLETGREWGSTGGEISAEKYPELPETDDSLTAAGHFCATDDGRSLDDEVFVRVEEKGPRPIEGVGTITMATAKENSSPDDAENKDAVSDIYGAATSSAEGSLLVDTENALEDDAVVEAIAWGKSERYEAQDNNPLDLLQREVSSTERPYVNFSEAAGAEGGRHVEIGTRDAGEEGGLKILEDCAGAAERGADGWIDLRQSDVRDSTVRETEQNTASVAARCEDDSCDGGVVDSESTTTNVAQGLQQSGAEDAAKTGNPMGEAPEKSSSTYGWAQSSLEDGVTVGNHEESKEDSILLGNVAAPIATSVEASAFEEPQRQRMSNDRVPAEYARNDETLPPVATDTEAPRTSSRQGADVGEEAPNEEKGGEGAARKPAEFRYPVRTETSRSGAVGSGAALPLPGMQLKNNVVGPIPPSVAPPVNIKADALREHNGMQEGPSHGTSVERTGWWRKCGNATKDSTLRWVHVAGGKGRAVTEKVLAVIKVWVAKTWHGSIEPRAERVRRRLEDAARSVFDEVGRHLADARLAEAL